MKINEDYLDDIDSSELTVSADDVETDVQEVHEEEFPIHFIFSVTRPGKNRTDSLKRVIAVCRKRLDMFFEGRHALFYQENLFSKMQPLLPTTEITDQTGLKLCIDGHFISIRHLWRFLFICYNCGIDRMYFIRPDKEQILFFYMSELYKFYEHPEQFRFLDAKNFFDAMIRLIIMLWPEDKQHQVDWFCNILHFDRYEKYLCKDMIPYTFMGHWDNNINIPVNDELQKKIESVDLDPYFLLDKKSYVSLIFSRMTDPMNQFLEKEQVKLKEIRHLSTPVHLSHVRLQYHPVSNRIETPIVFLFGYLGIFRSYCRSEQLRPVYMDACLAFKGECYFLDDGSVNPTSQFVQRCKEILGGIVTKEIVDTFWFWYDNPALLDD